MKSKTRQINSTEERDKRYKSMIKRYNNNKITILYIKEDKLIKLDQLLIATQNQD